MLQRIVVLNRSFQLLHGPKSVAELQDLLTEHTYRLHDLLSFGWVQYEGPLDSGEVASSDKGDIIWLGVSWDLENNERRGTRTSGRIEEGKGSELFKAITPDVSFVRLKSLPEWSLRGVSFVEAVIHRYSAWSSLSLNEITRTKLQIVGLPSHIVSRCSKPEEKVLDTSNWSLQSINLTENLLLWRWGDIWDILSVSKSVDKLMLSKCSYLFHPFSKADDYKEADNKTNDGFNLSELVISSITNYFDSSNQIAHLIHKFLSNFRKLDLLDLGSNQHVDNDSIQIILADLPSAPNLKCLRLNHTNITDCRTFFSHLNHVTPNCHEVDISNNALEWGTSHWMQQSPQVTSLNANFTNIYTWEQFLIVCTVFPNLKSVRLRHNPFLEEETSQASPVSNSTEWILQRYVRFALLPHLEWADGEHVDSTVRKEAELYIISVISNSERSSTLLPAGIRRNLYKTNSVLYQLLKQLCSRNQHDWDAILESLKAEVQRSEVSDQRAIDTAMVITTTLGRHLSEKSKHKVLEVVRNSPGMIQLQIECKDKQFQCSVFPDLTSIWRIKQQVSLLMEDPDVIQMKAYWILTDRQTIDTQHDEVLYSLPELERLETKYLSNNATPCSTLLTPQFGFLDYFGMTANQITGIEQPRYKILLTN